jgi:hypothetical protein
MPTPAQIFSVSADDQITRGSGKEKEAQILRLQSRLAQVPVPLFKPNQTKHYPGSSHETNHSTLFNLVLVSVSCSVASGHDVEIKCVRKSLLH